MASPRKARFVTASIVGVVVVCAVLGFVIVSSVMPSRRGSTSEASATSDGPARPGARDNEDHLNAGSKAESDWREPIPAEWEKVLGVTHSATAAEIRKAYLILVQQYHPDRFTSAAPEIAKYGAEKTKAINAAYLTARRLGRG